MSQRCQADINAICPYFTMFPLAFPHAILKRHGRAGQTVCDPFCGRGTTVLAARMLGMAAFGIDCSPVAAATAEAKLVHATPQGIVEAMRSLLGQVGSPARRPRGEFWRHAFHPEVLGVLCRLREGLAHGCETPERTALRAVLLGALHGPKTRRVSRSSYFSNQCPRTYAPKPDYALRFWRGRRAKPRRVDVERIVRVRAERYFGGSTPNRQPGYVVRGDARSARTLRGFRRELDWIITSPPYYGMRTYGPDQWLRLWFLGGPERPGYSAAEQLTHTSPESFAGDLRKVWGNLARRAACGCRLVVRFGAINDRKVDPVGLLRASLRGSGWRIVTIHAAGTPASGRRQADHFGARSEPLEEFDIWACREGGCTGGRAS